MVLFCCFLSIGSLSLAKYMYFLASGEVFSFHILATVGSAAPRVYQMIAKPATKFSSPEVPRKSSITPLEAYSFQAHLRGVGGLNRESYHHDISLVTLRFLE